ncbi:MAG: O-methyltransferase [Bacteroidota bacterium]
MKKHRGKPVVPITHPDIEAYCEMATTPEPDSILQLIASSDEELEYIDMLSGQLVGQLLKLLVASAGARRVLEIGTFTGYSAVMMASALPDDGRVDTIEMNLRYQDLAERHFRMFDDRGIIRLWKGNAQQIVKELEPGYDLVYLDGDKLQYTFYFEQCIPLLRTGGLLVADNVLWDGTVLQPGDHKAQAIAYFNEYVAKDARVEQVLLPFRDGVNIIRKK